MARFYGVRLGLIAAAATLCATITAAAPSFNEYGGVTASYDQIIVVSSAIDLPSFAMPVFVASTDTIVRSFPAYRPRHASPRASGAAVRPTSLAGWRSGRAVRLAG